jgi:hypothetical protein
MPGIYGEYTRPMVTSGGCAYATLDNYNQNYFGRGAVGAPTLSQTRSNELVVVPTYGGVGYQTLMNSKQPSCSGYAPIQQAYPAYAGGACGQFSSSLCG